MTEVLRTAWSVAWYGWRAFYNRSFRFSRLKVALVWQLILIGFLIGLARRVRPLPDAAGLEGLLVLMAVQMAWFGLMSGFSRGQFQLFQGLLVPLFQITPARPLAFVLGRVIEHIPTRLWSTLLWAWAYSAAVAGASRWLALALLAATGAAVGLVANLAGLLLVTLWARLSPRTLRNGFLLFGILTMALFTWAIIFLTTGGDVSDLALRMRELRTLFAGAVVLVGGLPGLAMLGMLLLRPEWVENLYRTGLTRVLELGEQEDSRPGRSVWLPLPDGPVRGVLAKEWIQWSRSRVTRVQALIWLFGTVGVYTAGRAMAGEPVARILPNLGSLSLLAWGLAYSHWVVRVFEAERAAIWLYRLAAVPAGTLILAKFMSVFLPSGLLVGLSVVVGGLAAGLDLPTLTQVLGWTLGALAAGCIGGFGAAAATAGEEAAEPPATAAAERMAPPQSGNLNGWYVLARMAGLLGPIALVLWTGAGMPGLPVPLAPATGLGVSALLPVVLLVGGYWLMARHWDSGKSG